MARYRGVDDAEWLERQRRKRGRKRWLPLFMLDVVLGVLIALCLVGVVVLFLVKTIGGR